MGDRVPCTWCIENKEQGDVNMKRIIVLTLSLLILSALPVALLDEESNGATQNMDTRLTYNVYYADVPLTTSNGGSSESGGAYVYRFKVGSENYENFLAALNDYSKLDYQMPQDYFEFDVIYVLTNSTSFKYEQYGNGGWGNIILSIEFKDLTLVKAGETQLHLYSGQEVTFTFKEPIRGLEIRSVGVETSSIEYVRHSFYDSDWDGNNVSYTCSFGGDYALIVSYPVEFVIEYSSYREDLSDNANAYGYIGLAIGVLCILSLVYLGRPQRLN